MFRAAVGGDETVASFDSLTLCRVSTYGHYSQVRTMTSHTATHDTQLFRFTFCHRYVFVHGMRNRTANAKFARYSC